MRNEYAKTALSEITLCKRKRNPRVAWQFARIAAGYAQHAGVYGAYSLLGRDVWPQLNALERHVQKILNADEALFVLTDQFCTDRLFWHTTYNISITPIDIETVSYILRECKWVSDVVNEQLALILSKTLSTAISTSKNKIFLDSTLRFIIARYTGPEIPPGSVELPEGGRLEWWLLTEL